MVVHLQSSHQALPRYSVIKPTAAQTLQRRGTNGKTEKGDVSLSSITEGVR